MPPKSIAKKGSSATKAVTLKSRARGTTHKSQPLPTYSPASGEDMSDLNRTLTHPVDTETSVNTVVVLHVDANLSDAVRAQIANRVRRAPMVDFITSDEDPNLGEEATPAPRKKAREECFCHRKQEDQVTHEVGEGGGV